MKAMFISALMVIIISHHSCYTKRELSIQDIAKLDSIDLRDSENHNSVVQMGTFHSYTILEGEDYKIPITHRVSSYFLTQDTFKTILTPKHYESGIIYYNIPVSRIKSVTFKKPSLWKTSLTTIGIPAGLIIGSLTWMFLTVGD